MFNYLIILTTHKIFCIPNLQIQVRSNLTKIPLQMSVNSSTRTIAVHNLQVGGEYTVRIAAYTRAGLGPYSPASPLSLTAGRQQGPHAQPSHSASDTWLMITSVGLILMVLSAAVIAVLYLRKRQLSKDPNHLAGEPLIIS